MDKSVKSVKHLTIFVVVLSSLILAGCAGIPKGRDATNAPLKLRPDEVLIFGKIQYKFGGEPVEDFGILGRPFILLISDPDLSREAFREQVRKPDRILYLTDDQVIATMVVDKDGSYYYTVPAGFYQMHSIGIVGHAPDIYPALTFQASEPGKTYYLGTTIVDVEARFNLAAFLFSSVDKIYSQLNGVEVVDEMSIQRGDLLQEVEGSDDIPIEKALLKEIPDQLPIFIRQMGALRK